MQKASGIKIKQKTKLTMIKGKSWMLDKRNRTEVRGGLWAKGKFLFL